MSYIRCTVKLIVRTFNLRSLGDLAFVLTSLLAVLGLLWSALTGAWLVAALLVAIELTSASLLAEYHAALLAGETVSLVEAGEPSLHQ
jgi:hypothetical protein